MIYGLTEYQIIYYILDVMQLGWMLGAIVGSILYAFRQFRKRQHSCPGCEKVE